MAGDALRGFIAIRSTNSPAAPPLPSLVPLPGGKVVHCCRQIASDSWLLLPLSRAHSQLPALPSLSLGKTPAEVVHNLTRAYRKSVMTPPLQTIIWNKNGGVHLCLSLFLYLSLALPHSPSLFTHLLSGVLLGNEPKPFTPATRTPGKSGDYIYSCCLVALNKVEQSAYKNWVESGD